jgi:serine/threonine protein kinase/Tfp pilus assembly protein PilF
VSENHHDDDKTQTHVPLMKDTTVGHYRIVGKIGAGGMGEVYLADDTELDRRVALKFMPPHLCRDEDCRARFKREAQATAKLDHPNIVTVHEVSEHKGQPYFVMQHIEGKSLRQTINQQELTVERAIELALGISEGLQEAHRVKIIHRDIKPGNILIHKDGKPKILDFGLAAVAGTTKLTQTGVTLGTLGFMSPEQVEGKPVDERSDLFSLGIVLYEMITWRRPFTGEYHQAVSYSILHDTPEPLIRYKANVPEALQQIVSKLLEKDPALRYQSAAGVISDLKRLIRADALEARKRSDEPGRGRRRVIFSASAVAILVLLVLILKPWRFEIASDQPAVAATQRLAVLYLVNRGSPDDEYISYGITEDLTVDLTRIGTIGVAPMRSVLKYKDSDDNLEDIARQLHVNLILDGSLHKTGDSIRVSAQLVDVSTGTNLWAERWQEPVENLPHIKEALAQGIVSALAIDSSIIRAAQIGSPEAKNPVSYDYYLRGKYAFEHKTDESDVEVALGLYRKAIELDSTLLAARAGIGLALQYKGEFEKAEKEVTEMLSKAQEKNLRADMARATEILAGILREQSHYDKAEEYYSRSLDIYKELGDYNGEMWVLSYLMVTFGRQQRFDEAMSLSGRVLEICDQLGDPRAKASALNKIAIIHDFQGNYDSALHYYQVALEIAEKQGDRDIEANVLTNIGSIYIYKGDLDKAAQNIEKGLELHMQLGDKDDIGSGYTLMSAISSSRGEYRKSVEFDEKAAAIYKDLGNERMYNALRGQMASGLMNVGEYDSAIAMFQEVLKAGKEFGDSMGMIIDYQNLGMAYFYKGDYEHAGKYYYDVLESRIKSGDEWDVAFSSACLCEFHYFLQNDDSSRRYCESALSYSEKADDAMIQSWASKYLAALDVKAGNFHEGIKRLQEFADSAKADSLFEDQIQAQRLLGQSLLEYGQSEADRDRGHKALQEALALAEDKELAHEIRWIGEILKKHNMLH